MKNQGGFSHAGNKNLFFGYAGESVLRDFSLCAKRGNITAITGESGSGKSTLFKLILGLYEPQSGSITVNGEIPLDASLRGLFAYVPQEIWCFRVRLGKHNDEQPHGDR